MFNTRDLAVAIITSMVVILLSGIFGVFAGRLQYVNLAMPVLAAFVCGASSVYAFYSWRRPRVDPWATQRDVMSRSGQRLPLSPSITPEAALYVALVMEEAAETAANMADELRACMRFDPELAQDAPRWAMDTPGLLYLVRGLETSADQMHAGSRDIRNACSQLPRHFTARMSPKGARAALDGAADMAVVVCGFAEASGLPGMAGYVEAQRANLSKANPVTGMIERDPSGKWIKGPRYVEPNMGRVLADHAHGRG